MFVARFFLLVLLLSFGELFVLLWSAERISLLMTLLLCVLTGVVGGAMVKRQGLSTLGEIQKAAAQGRMPATEILSGIILIIIGAMLLTPGFITDIFAFTMLIPPVRKGVARYLGRYFQKRMTGGSTVMFSFGDSRRDPNPVNYERPEDVVIEVDAEEPKS